MGVSRETSVTDPELIRGIPGPGRANDENAIPAAQVFLDGDLTPSVDGEDPVKVFRLPVAELGEQPSPRVQPVLREERQVPVGGQSIGSAIERQAGIVIPHFGHERLQFVGRDVGRVGDDQVVGAAFDEPGVRSEDAPLAEGDLFLEPVLGRVSARDFQGCLGKVEGVDPDLRPCRRHRERDATGAGAEVCDLDLQPGRQAFAGPEDELFRFGSRDEDVRRDADPEVEEVREANQMLERNAVRAALDERQEGLGLAGSDCGCEADPPAQAWDAGDVFEEEFGLDLGRFNIRRGQPGDGSAQQVGCGFSGALHAVRGERRRGEEGGQAFAGRRGAAWSRLRRMDGLIAQLDRHLRCRPRLGEGVYLAKTAVVVGDVTLGDRSSVWYGAVLRGDINRIVVGHDSNVQDNAVLHLADDYPCLVGNWVTIGHSANVHACTIGDECLVGMGATVLDGAVVGEQCLIGAHALVTPGTVIPPGSMVLGSPAKVVRPLRPEERAGLKHWAQKYVTNGAYCLRHGLHVGAPL